MNQDNKNFFPFAEDPSPRDIPDISDEIAADVAAILGSDDPPKTEVDAIVSAVEDSTGKFGTGFEAIMAEAGDPSLEIGADVEAIMAESGAFSGMNAEVPAEEVADPTVAISEDVAAIMAEAGLSPMDPDTSFDTEILPIADEFPFDTISPERAVNEEIADNSVLFHAPTPEETVSAESETAAVQSDELLAAEYENAVPVPFVTPDSTGFFNVPTDAVPNEEAEIASVDTPEAENIANTLPETEAQSDALTSDDATRRINTDDPLYHDLLNDPAAGVDIGADENAITSAGLIHPADADLEKIIQETLAGDSADSSSSSAGNNTDLAGISNSGTSDMLIQDYVDTHHPIEQPPVEKEKPEKPLPKRRPKMKKGYGFFGLPHVAATLIWLAITVAIGVSLGRMIWICAAEVLAFGKPDQEFTVTITSADNIDTVAAKLKNAGLIKYPELFKLYAGITNAEEELSAGTFVLNSKYDYNALVTAMTYHSSARETVTVLIPEGYTCAQIFALLEEKGVCSAAELEEYAANGEIKERWFLEGLQRGDKYCLEGYLFPDSYEFYTNDEPARVLGKFLDNFDARFTDIMKEKIEPLNQRMAEVLANRGYTQDYIDSHKFTIREIVIIASMIERETANDSESYDIASVIYNRLTNPGNFPYLNIDATIIYALGGNIDPVTGKTKPLTKADLEIDSPYNTYTRPGLIPGPISNPGRNSLNAALDPNVTAYYFYVYNPNISKHLFAKTADEHNRNVEYVRSLEENQ